MDLVVDVVCYGQKLEPLAAYLNGEACNVTLAFVPSNNLPDWATKRASGASIESSLQPVSLKDDQFIGVDGLPFNITGIP